MTIVGVALAVFLMVFQGSLLVGFIQAAGRVVRSIDGSVWIVPRGVPCFDLSARLPRRFADLARQTSGVNRTIAVASGFANNKFGRSTAEPFRA